VAWADVWTQQPPGALQPSAIDLERLDPAEWSALMSWFSGTSRTTGTSRGRSRTRRRKDSPGQLSLDLEIVMEQQEA